jgi:hypothetical protein
MHVLLGQEGELRAQDGKPLDALSLPIGAREVAALLQREKEGNFFRALFWGICLVEGDKVVGRLRCSSGVRHKSWI